MKNMKLPNAMILRYLNNRKTDLMICQKALEENNFETLLKIAHQIKGNALSFGFEELGLIAIEIEKQASLENQLELSHLIKQLSHFLKLAFKQNKLASDLL